MKCTGQAGICKLNNTFPTNTEFEATVNIILYVHIAATLYTEYKNTY